MAGTTSFPTGLDSFPTIDANTQENAPGAEHDVVHSNVHAALAAVQAKVGVDASADAGSLDARVAAVESGKLDASALGVAGGAAQLDGSGQVPAGQLPSYVDDVLEFDDLASFPATGATGKIYIALDPAPSKQYRWSGSAYIELVASPGTTDDVPEGSSNLYFTDERAQDAIGTALSAGTGDGVSLEYDDAGNAINPTNTDKGSTAVADHEAALDPHAQYALDSDLGTAATTDASDYATAAQGGKADSAVQEIVPGTNVSVDNTDPQRPIVSAYGGGGGGGGSGNPLTPYIPATVVQDAASANSNSSSKEVTLSRTPWPGNVLILCVSIATTATISSIVQTGVTWTQVAANSGINPSVAIWKGIVGSSPGTTVTVNFSTTGYNAFWVGEFNGITGTLGVHSESTSVAAAYDTGIIVPASYSLIVSVMGTTNGSTPFLAAANNEVNSGIRMLTPAFSGLSGSATALGVVNPSAYYSGSSTGVRYGNVSGNVASVIAAIT